MAGHSPASSLQVRQVRTHIFNARGSRDGVYTGGRASDVARALHSPRTVILSNGESISSGSGMRVIGAGTCVSEKIEVGGQWFNILAWGAAVRECLANDPHHYLKDFIDSRVSKGNLATFVLAKPQLYAIWNLLSDK